MLQPQKQEDYTSKVYNALKQKVEGFDKTEEQFRNEIQSPEYASKVHNALKIKVEGFNKSIDEFNSLVKKKADTTSTTPVQKLDSGTSTGSLGGVNSKMQTLNKTNLGDLSKINSPKSVVPKIDKKIQSVLQSPENVAKYEHKLAQVNKLQEDVYAPDEAKAEQMTKDQEDGNGFWNTMKGVGNAITSVPEKINKAFDPNNTHEAYQKGEIDTSVQIDHPFQEQINQVKKLDKDNILTEQEVLAKARELKKIENQKVLTDDKVTNLMTNADDETKDLLNANAINKATSLNTRQKSISGQISILRNKHAQASDDEKPIIEQQINALQDEANKVENQKITANDAVRQFALNYNPIANFSGKALAGVEKMGGKALYALGSLDKSIGGYDDNVFTVSGEKLVKAGEDLDSKFHQESLESIANSDNPVYALGRYAVQAGAGIVPYATLGAENAVLSGASKVAVIASGAGGKTMEMHKEMKADPSIKYTPAQIFLASAGYAGAEALMAGELGTMFKGSKGAVSAILKSPVAREQFEQGVRAVAKESLDGMAKMGGKMIHSAKLGASMEAIKIYTDETVLGKHIDNKGAKIMSGAIEMGALPLLLEAFPAVAGHFTAKLSPKVDIVAVHNNVQKIKEFTKSLDDPTLTPEAKTLIKTSIQKLNTENETTLKKSYKAIQNLTPTQIENLLTIDGRKAEIRKEVDAIKDPKNNAPNNVKAQALADKKAEWNKLEDGRMDVFENKYNALDTQTEKEKDRLNSDADESLQNELNPNRDKVLKLTPEQIKERASEIHKTEQAFNGMNIKEIDALKRTAMADLVNNRTEEQKKNGKITNYEVVQQVIKNEKQKQKDAEAKSTVTDQAKPEAEVQKPTQAEKVEDVPLTDEVNKLETTENIDGKTSEKPKTEDVVAPEQPDNVIKVKPIQKVEIIDKSQAKVIPTTDGSVSIEADTLVENRANKPTTAESNTGEIVQSTVDISKGKNEPVKSTKKQTESQDSRREKSSEEISKDLKIDHKVYLDFKDKVKNVPYSEDVKSYLSGITIEDVTGNTPTNKQFYEQMSLDKAREHGDTVLEHAKEVFGDDPKVYIPKTIAFLDAVKLDNFEKAVVYASLENVMDTHVKENSSDASLKKLQELVYADSQANRRNSSKGINAGRLTRLHNALKNGIDVKHITDTVFSTNQSDAKTAMEGLTSTGDGANEIQDDIHKEETAKLKYTQEDFDAELKKAVEEAIVEQNKKGLQRSGKNIADKIRTLKISKDVIKADYTLGAYNLAIETIAQLVEKGATIAQAIKNVVEDANFKGITEKKLTEDILGTIGEKGKRVISEETKRKIYIKLLNKHIEALDLQIEAKKRDVITKEDKYKNDQEIIDLRNLREEKQKKLAEVDPNYGKAKKIANDLKKAKKSLENYERKLKEKDFSKTEKPTKEVAKKLQELRDARNIAKEKFLKEKKKYTDSLKEPKAPLTKEEIENKKYESDIKRQENLLDKQINDLKNTPPPKSEEGKYKAWSESISKKQTELEALRKAKKEAEKPTQEEIELKNLNDNIKRTEKAIKELENPTTVDNIGKNSTISPELSKLKNKLKALREEKAKNEPKAITNDAVKVVKQALIDHNNGEFTRTVKRNGVETKVLDWTKMVGRANDPANIKKVVEEVLEKQDFSQAEKDRLSEALEQEYDDLSERNIKKGTDDLVRRNLIKPNAIRKTDVQRMVQLQKQGLLGESAKEYDRLINRVVGLSKAEQVTLDKINVEIEKLKTMSETVIDGKKLDHDTAKSQEAKIVASIKKIVNLSNIKNDPISLKALYGISQLADLTSKSILGTLGNGLQNLYSGFRADALAGAKARVSGYNTPELRKLLRDQKTVTREHMLSNRGMDYGEVVSPMSHSQNMITDWIHDGIDAKLGNGKGSRTAHGLMNVAEGHAFLNVADSVFKTKVVGIDFIMNVIDTLTTERKGQEKMTRKEALNFVSEALTGVNFEKAEDVAKKWVDAVNENHPNALPNDVNSIKRYAFDIVRENLLSGSKLSIEEINDSFDSAYKSGGKNIGHEANNFATKGIQQLNHIIEKQYKEHIDNKEYGKALAVGSIQFLYKNLINRFVGGGLNWAVLEAEAGLPMIGIAHAILKGKNELDLVSDRGLKDYKKQLQERRDYESTMYRGVLGTAITASAILAHTALTGNFMFGGGDDENKRKWNEYLAKNPEQKKIFNKFSPDTWAFALAIDDDKWGSWIMRKIGTRLDESDNVVKLFKSMDDPNSSTAGAFGAMVGSLISTPFGWRMVRDTQRLTHELKGDPMPQTDYKVTSFYNGLFKGDFVDWIGKRPGVNYDYNKAVKELDNKKDEFTRFTNGVCTDLVDKKITPEKANKQVEEKYKGNKVVLEKAYKTINDAYKDKEVRKALEDEDEWFMQFYKEDELDKKAIMFAQKTMLDKDFEPSEEFNKAFRKASSKISKDRQSKWFTELKKRAIQFAISEKGKEYKKPND